MNLLTAQEVAKWLRVSLQFVYDHTSGRREPAIPFIQLGKAKRFRREDIEAFIERCVKTAA